MEGFWTSKQTESKTRPDGKALTCISCGLSKQCKSPKIQPYGNFKKKILIIGEAPGEVEDARGKPWQGKTGKLLRRVCEELKIDLFDDCLSINAVNCRPVDKNGNNRAPTNYEMDCCRRHVLQTIEQYKPKLIIPLGTAAVYSLIGHRWKKDLGTISKWRGWTIPDQDFQTWICPTFHPSYVERSDNGPELTVWVLDLKRAFEMLSQPFLKHVEPRIDIIEDLYILTNITNPEIAFDYETTGLKPHAEGHRIVCCAVAPSEDHAYVFMMPKTKMERQPFIDLLVNPKIGKIAQNMKYEHAWSLVRLKTEVQNWVWDTMLASHLFDNRPGITSLQFQVYVQFGVIDYKDETEPYLKANGDSANDINRIMTLVNKPGGKEILMKRCALDAVYEYRLATKQRLNILPF
jgi:uracil-DNA glycosylase